MPLCLWGCGPDTNRWPVPVAEGAPSSPDKVRPSCLSLSLDTALLPHVLLVVPWSDSLAPPRLACAPFRRNLPPLQWFPPPESPFLTRCFVGHALQEQSPTSTSWNRAHCCMLFNRRKARPRSGTEDQSRGLGSTGRSPGHTDEHLRESCQNRQGEGTSLIHSSSSSVSLSSHLPIPGRAHTCVLVPSHARVKV